MAHIDEFLKVEYRIVFFPVATYRRFGDIKMLTVLGMPVFKSVGESRSLFGIKSRTKNVQ